MKKFLISFFSLFLFIPLVYADDITDTTYIWSPRFPTSSQLNSFSTAFDTAYDIFNSQYTYDSYSIIMNYNSGGLNTNIITLFLFSSSNIRQSIASSDGVPNSVLSVSQSDNTDFVRYVISSSGSYSSIPINSFSLISANNYFLYDSNYNFISLLNLSLTGIYQDNISLEINDSVPYFKNLIQYNSWADYVSANTTTYTTVNLDSYEYVILSLKNYNLTQAFQTDLQVKGSIGITPIYNFGQSSKDSITGVKVQDRCNPSYEDFTIYPLYILQQDLYNNAIYVVKSCSLGSSFKFSNDIFDITYITSENVNNPTVTIGNNTYDVIPYNDLPSSATKNEEENYIPGESSSADSTHGLNNAIKQAQDILASLWDTITYFTSLISMIINSLPLELKGILLSAFSITIVIGIIKFFVK